MGRWAHARLYSSPQKHFQNIQPRWKNGNWWKLPISHLNFLWQRKIQHQTKAALPGNFYSRNFFRAKIHRIFPKKLGSIPYFGNLLAFLWAACCFQSCQNWWFRKEQLTRTVMTSSGTRIYVRTADTEYGRIIIILYYNIMRFKYRGIRANRIKVMG